MIGPYVDAYACAFHLDRDQRAALTRLGLCERYWAKYGREGTPISVVPQEPAESLQELGLVRICFGHPRSRAVKFTPDGRQVLAAIRTENAEALKTAMDCLALDTFDVRDLMQSGCL